MSDVDHDDGFDEAFKGFGEDPAPATPPQDPVTPPATPGAAAEPPKADDPTPPAEEPKKDDQPPAEPPKKEGEEDTPPAADAPKKEEGAEPPKAPETPPAPEEPKPLTEESVKSIIQNIRTEERATTKELETTTNEVLEAYYPEGLTNVLVDQNTGKELKTPQDVVDATGGEMPLEQAAQWLMNEQYKLDTKINAIKDDAQKIAETTINFKRDGIAAVQKYEPLFKWQPQLQEKVFKLLMNQVTADEKKGVILKAPDVLDLYDTYLEPYQKAYEFSQGQPATNPTPPAGGTPPAPATPGADDRLDESGDGGASPVDDPTDFAQQVTKELAKGI